MFVKVALNLPINQLFLYEAPEEYKIKKYQRVIVPFKNNKLTGIIIDITEDKNYIKDDIKVKPIIKILDEEPIITEETIKIAEWISQKYLSSFGETINSIIPSAIKPKKIIHSYHTDRTISVLNKIQQNVYESIKKDICRYSIWLLHGITGSGKTEIYKYLAKDTLERGRSVLILIPEISLTPQNLERFYKTFGNIVAIYHSKLTDSERLYEWKRALNGEAKLVIGPRSAIFLPLKNIGLIIVDEEHESSYKSNNTPRYNAKNVAIYRAKESNALLIFGSATPLVETYYKALTGKYKLAELKERFNNIPLPDVEIIDLKKDKNKNNLISERLLSKILEELNKNNQVIIFINRRGFAPVLICMDCGYIYNCPMCDLPMTLHNNEKKLKCHHCGLEKDIPTNCNSCNSINLKDLGSGTERLEYYLSNILHNYRIGRMDLDTTRKRTSYLEILKMMKDHKIDILIGTQMIAKGHDIPNVSLCGIILPDIMLNLPDFRSGERTFILLTQSIGRAGRKNIQGKAIVETFLPDNFIIKCASNQDYLAFYNYEIKKRELFGYPPFLRLARIVLSSQFEVKIKEFSEQLKNFIDKIITNNKSYSDNIKIIGPTTCPLEKLKNNYRYHIIFKSKNINILLELLKEIKLYLMNSKISKYINFEIDIDPYTMM